MGEILTVTHSDGTTFLLHSSGSTATCVKDAEQSIELNGSDTVTISVESTSVLPFSLGDTITIGGIIYTLNLLPSVAKTSSRLFSYKATFEGLHYLLLNTAWIMPFSALSDALAGDLETYATQLVTNLNRAQPNMWEIGTIKSDTETKVLTFSDTNCLDVLQQICEEWEVEFSITKNGEKYQISIVNEVGNTINYVFKYGAGGGLYDLQRNGCDDSDFGTRIYFYGGSSNIPNDYFNERQSSRLCLSKKVVGNVLTNDPTRNDSYIEQPDAVNLYGRIERTKVFEDIYPNRIGSVTAIDSSNRLKFSDNTMFNLTATDGDGQTLYLISGTTAKIHFNTGALAGYDFDISDYDNNTHTFTINELLDENNFKFPSENNTAFRVSVGDEYIITDIVMPSSYITEAQTDLQTAAQDWYEKHCAPAVEYVITMDEMFLTWLATQLNVTGPDTPIFHIGDKITVSDSQLWNGTKQFRVTSLERDLTKEQNYTLGIAITDERRRKYIWTRRRNRHILPTVIKAGLFDVGHLTNKANEIFRNTLNTGRLGVLFDDGTKKLRGEAISDSSIISRMIGSGAVLSDNIANEAIVAAKLAANAVIASKIADGAVGTDKLEDLAVVAGKIASSAVTSAKIAQGAVGTNALASNAVTAANISTGAVTLEKLDFSATRIFERSTMAIEFDVAEKKLTIGAGKYTNELLGEFNIAETTITKPSDDDEFVANKEYNVYYNYNNDNFVATSEELTARNGNILLGRIGTENNSDRTFAPRIFSADPISGSRIIGGTLRFIDVDGNTKMVNEVDIVAKTASNKATTLETVIGADSNSGLRKKITDMETEIGDAATSGSIINDISIIKTAMSGMRSKLDGITYEDCAAQACKTLRLDTLPWES
jgi:hypothetical protein